jgi:hypothetical protein
LSRLQRHDVRFVLEQAGEIEIIFHGIGATPLPKGEKRRNQEKFYAIFT